MIYKMLKNKKIRNTTFFSRFALTPSFGGGRARWASLLCLLLCTFAISGFAQRATVRATIEPADILIGEHSVITLEVISPLGRNISFPMYGDTIIKGIEVIKMEKVDTTLTEVMTLKQRYIVTSFDSTLYHIPSMMVIDGNDTLRSNNFGLKVSSPQLSDATLQYLELLKNKQTDSIDFAKLQLTDIKDIQDPETVWLDYLDYVLIAILILLVLAIIGVILYFVIKKKKKGYYFKPKVILPPHTVAFQELNNLKEKKLHEQGQDKEYYTELTEILRRYIDERFNVDALEMTSDEIMDAIRKKIDADSAKETLGQILSIADLVKFAKYTPPADQNELCLMNAYLFVNQTKIEEVIPVGTKPPADEQPMADQPQPSAYNNTVTNS